MQPFIANMKLIAGFLFCSLAIHLAAYSQDPHPEILKVGSKAPQIDVLTWIKGDAREHLRKNRYYIVEFGTLKCKPCRASIPHLTDIARKYKGQVPVISIFVLGNGGHPAKDTLRTNYTEPIEAFVRSKGDSIGYNVAVDTPTQSMFKQWLKAGASRGVPKAFIINSEGTIAWIGHPFKLSEAIDAFMLDGK